MTESRISAYLVLAKKCITNVFCCHHHISAAVMNKTELTRKMISTAARQVLQRIRFLPCMQSDLPFLHAWLKVSGQPQTSCCQVPSCCPLSSCSTVSWTCSVVSCVTSAVFSTAASAFFLLPCSFLLILIILFPNASDLQCWKIQSVKFWFFAMNILNCSKSLGYNKIPYPPDSLIFWGLTNCNEWRFTRLVLWLQCQGKRPSEQNQQVRNTAFCIKQHRPSISAATPRCPSGTLWPYFQNSFCCHQSTMYWYVLYKSLNCQFSPFCQSVRFTQFFQKSREIFKSKSVIFCQWFSSRYALTSYSLPSNCSLNCVW